MVDITNTIRNALAWDDIVKLIEPNSAPVLKRIMGTAETISATTYEWYEDRNFGTKAKVATAISNTDTNIVVDDILVFAAGQYIAIGDEKLNVTAVNTSTNTLTVTRAGLNTTASAAIAGAEIFVVGTESIEGSGAREARNTVAVQKDNYTEIFKETIEISGSQMKRKLNSRLQANAIANIPLTDERVNQIQSQIFDEEEMKKINYIIAQVEKTICLGTKFVDVTGKNRKLGGLKNYIMTNVIDLNNATALTLSIIDDLMDQVAETGAFDESGTSSYALYVSPAVARTIKTLKEGKVMDININNGQVGVSPIITINTSQGEIEVVTTRNIDSNSIYLVNLSTIGIKPFREFTVSDWTNGDDVYRAQILGELTFEVKNEEQMGMIKNIGA
jgi:hypothetical protein